jgi:hypothetical protein
MLGRVAARCGNNILLGCKATTEYLQESLTVISINNTFKINTCSVYDISSTQKNATNDGPVILLHFHGANSDNSPIKNNEIKNDHKQQLHQNTIKSRPNDKFSCIGPRTDCQQLHSVDHDKRIINDNISNRQSKTKYTNKELLSKPKAKNRKKNRTETTTNSKSENLAHYSTHQERKPLDKPYHQSAFNYYWPLDPTHLIHKEEFLQQVGIRKEIPRQFSPASRSFISTTPISKSFQKIDKKWKKTHLDQINIPFDYRNQSYLVYQARIDNTEIYPTMSQQLNKRVLKPTVLPSITQGMGRGGGIPPTTTGWQTAGSKRLEKKLGDVFELTSDKYLPKRLPLDTIPIATIEEKTDILLTIVVQIKLSTTPEL